MASRSKTTTRRRATCPPSSADHKAHAFEASIRIGFTMAEVETEYGVGVSIAGAGVYLATLFAGAPELDFEWFMRLLRSTHDELVATKDRP